MVPAAASEPEAAAWCLGEGVEAVASEERGAAVDKRVAFRDGSSPPAADGTLHFRETRMHVQIAVLADSANLAEGGKLNLLGAFNMLPAKQFPATLPAMSLVLRLCIAFDEAGKKHELVIQLYNADLKVLARAAAIVDVPDVPAGLTGTVNQIVNFAGLSFTRPGNYHFGVSWDGAEIVQVPFYVVLAQ